MEFWHVRNSWGTYWGEQGYARIMMHKDNLALERDCDWGVPLLQPPTDHEETKMDSDSSFAAVSEKKPRVSKGTYHDYSCPCYKKTQVMAEREGWEGGGGEEKEEDFIATTNQYNCTLY